MEEFFRKFCDNIRLTDKQEEDAKTKYDWVCETLHNNYYTDTTYNWTSKFLFGSYRKKTNIRPISEDQDVDAIFKMPEDKFDKYNNHEWNGQSALLQKIRYILQDTYSTTEEIRGRGKVVLVKFSEGTHNVEILPAWEEEDGTFTIPNTENWWSWEIFDPKSENKTFAAAHIILDHEGRGITD